MRGEFLVSSSIGSDDVGLFYTVPSICVQLSSSICRNILISWSAGWLYNEMYFIRTYRLVNIHTIGLPRFITVSFGDFRTGLAVVNLKSPVGSTYI